MKIFPRVFLALLLCGPACADNLSSIVGRGTGLSYSSANGGMLSANVGATGGVAAQPVVRIVASGAADTSADTVPTAIKWTSPTAAAKTEVLPACNAAASKLNPMQIADGANTAASYPIIVTASGSTLDGNPFLIIRNNGASYSFVCDGVSDWSVN